MVRACIYNPGRIKKIKVIDIVVILIILGMSIFALIKYSFFRGELARGVGEFGLVGVFIMAFILESIPQIIHPFSSVILATGLGTNVFYATLFVCVGSFFGALAGFEIGRKYGFGLICPLLSKKSLTKTVYLWDKYGHVFVFIAAISPLPYFPMIFGSLGMRRKFFWMFGLIPRIITFAFLGMLLNWGINLM